MPQNRALMELVHCIVNKAAVELVQLHLLVGSMLVDLLAVLGMLDTQPVDTMGTHCHCQNQHYSYPHSISAPKIDHTI